MQSIYLYDRIEIRRSEEKESGFLQIYITFPQVPRIWFTEERSF